MVKGAMIYRFDGYELDTARCELRLGGGPRPVEPQVFALLRLLIENRERLVGKDEIIDRIWGGRFISDSAVASRIKSARQAIGDSGAAQGRIRTVNRQGFRFVAQVETTRAEAETAPEPEPAATGDERPSIAVLPFSLVGVAGAHGAISDALPHDLIVELSRLHWLFVIARGSSFQFRGAEASFERVKAALDVRYCLGGSVELNGTRIAVIVELCDTRHGGVVWSERYVGEIDAVHAIRSQIAHAVVAALEVQIPLNEARRALKSPSNLDAWSAYHLGLHHMYQFSREGALRAGACFAKAVEREPSFARAHAGLSFTRHEEAFLSFAEDRREAAADARRWAERSLELDPLDPFCNLVMGRALWLTGDLEGGLPWLDRAVELNPNYAQAQYSSAWTRALLGEAAQGRDQVSLAMDLSPLDPLLYGMLGVRCISHLGLAEPQVAASWGEKAARSPNAHPLIELIAAAAHGLNGDEARAGAWARSAQDRRPGLGAAQFFTAFPFRDTATRRRIGETFARLGV